MAKPARHDHDQQNREAAAIILQGIARYGGEQSGLVRWARMILPEWKSGANA